MKTLNQEKTWPFLGTQSCFKKFAGVLHKLVNMCKEYLGMPACLNNMSVVKCEFFYIGHWRNGLS